jgi:hypothetical protein
MRELVWRVIARIVSARRVTAWLLQRAVKTPYFHIRDLDGSLFMGRWWLFNPYPAQSDGGGSKRGWRGRLPSIRIHHICRPDTARDFHDHPWDARTIVLRGFYIEELPGGLHRVRGVGDTGRLLFGQYHRIDSISEDGVWTLFITWRKRGTWGFLVDGKKVPWREYLNEPAA